MGTYVNSKLPRAGLYAAWTDPREFPFKRCGKICEVDKIGRRGVIVVYVELGSGSKLEVRPFLIMNPKAGLIYKQTIHDLKAMYHVAERDFKTLWLDTAEAALEKASRY